ncbi:hypothetical protein T190820D02B_10814 [Tenacibaculum sp. 190524A05c]
MDNNYVKKEMGCPLSIKQFTTHRSNLFGSTSQLKFIMPLPIEISLRRLASRV